MTPALRKSPRRRAAQQRVGFFPFILIGFILLVEAAFINLLPLSLRYFIDSIMKSHDLGAIYPIIAVITGALVVVAVAGLVRDILTASVVSRLISRLRRRVFDRLQHSNISSSVPEENAEMLEEFSIDCGEIEHIWRDAVPRGIFPALMAMISTVLLFVIDWRVALTAVLLWPWALLTPRALAVRACVAQTARDDDEERLLTAMEENLAAQPAVRAFSLEQTASSTFRKRNEVLNRSSTGAGFAQALTERLTGAGILTIQVFVLSLSMRLAFGKEMTIGSVAAAQMLTMILSQAMLTVSGYLPEREKAEPAMDRIEEIIATPNGPEDKRDAKVMPPVETEIGFSNVSFSYGGAGLSIAFLTARIPKGAFVAFVGPSGCGKSTLVRLLIRFYDVDDGRITIDGHDLKSVTRASLRARIGVVLQENPVFSMTLGENIRVGRPDASQEAIIEVSKAVGLHELIMALPQGYDTPAGPGGVIMTAPVIQRLAIARSILRNPDVLLLDEVTSALEPTDELAVNESLRNLRNGRTMISMSHRLATTADADHIFMMEEGKIVEQGSHFELLAANGPYAKLWEKQAGFRFSSDGRHVDVMAERLKAFPILEKLSDEKLSEIAPYFATETFQPGREVVRQNDPGDKFYIIARGKMEVWRTEDHSGRVMRMAVLEEGDFFGEITLITGFPRTATVRALTVCTCISLERGQFNRMLEGSPELLRELSDVALKRLRQSSRAASPSVQ